jgi:hypothetical protein
VPRRRRLDAVRNAVALAGRPVRLGRDGRPRYSAEDVTIMRTVAEIALLLLVGWVAGAETGSWCCVQPVVERLPYETL